MDERLKKVVDAARLGAEKYAGLEMDYLRRFSSIDCGTGNLEGNAKVVEILEEILSDMDVKIEKRYAEGYGNHLIVRINEGAKGGKILLLAHTDTVFKPGDTEKYPFRIEGDFAYGLGIADCKGGVVVSLFGAKIMQQAGLLPDKELVFILNCDEEVGSLSARSIFEEEVRDAECAFSFEPTREQNGIYTFRAGVGVGTIKCHGKPAHAQAAYLEGRSAVLELANLIVKLYEKNDPELEIFYNVSPMKGGESAGSVAEFAEASILVSPTSARAIEQIKADIADMNTRGMVDGCEYSVEMNIIHPPMERTEGNVKTYEKVKYAGELMGLELPESRTMGSGDTCIISTLGLPVVDCLGPYMYGIHTVNEHLFIPSVKERTQLFATLLGTL